MQIKRIVRPGDEMPAFYGVAWQDWMQDHTVCYPVPLNLLIAWARAFSAFVRWGAVTMKANPRAAYWQGYEAGRKSVPRIGEDEARAPVDFSGFLRDQDVVDDLVQHQRRRSL